MTNLTNALKADGCTVHIIRLLRIFPDFNPHRVPENPACPVAQELYLAKASRTIPSIDPHDVAEVAGRLSLSDNSNRIGAFHTMNNGREWLSFEEVAGTLSDKLGESITIDGSYEGSMEFWGPMMGKKSERL